MKKISAFDLGIIIAFVVITLLGAGAWYYLSGQLAATKDLVSGADADFLKYSQHQPYLPTPANEKILTEDISLIQSQLDPLIKSKLQAEGNKLASVTKEDTVAWKHDLDAEVSRLNAAAKVRGVSVPKQFLLRLFPLPEPEPRRRADRRPEQAALRRRGAGQHLHQRPGQGHRHLPAHLRGRCGLDRPHRFRQGGTPIFSPARPRPPPETFTSPIRSKSSSRRPRAISGKSSPTWRNRPTSSSSGA